ncbi:helix-turn-helix transcriptional regulator [Chitinophaga sp. GCM10012297]|uniref:Helix-turn-helix transcriptional regulator n=1 Tax=Chitinophaga chungangae TaxID=2821488 RepID=A0ABS3YBG6_9BACT|nr:helix-turn-helix transcriptional regulator [Chitinophaga chungangae]MBO9151996.1 helix-turn-helix transcriptional regulator [Chitinophaga chungangae]
MENQPLPVRDMWIDQAEITESLPVAVMHKDQLNGLLSCACVDRIEDECCTIISQYVRMGPLSIWHQKVHPKQQMNLRPQTPFRNIILHFMMGSDVIAEIKNGETVLLGGGFMDMFNLASYPNEAPLQKDQDFDSLHINIQPGRVKEIVKLFPELAVLKAPKIMQADGPLRRDKDPLPINDVCWMMIRDILTCRYLGDHAHFFLQRIAVNMLTIYEKLMDMPVPHGLSENNEQKVRECFVFLRQYYAGQHTVKQLAAIFGLNARVLHDGFEAIYGCTIGQFQYSQRMRLAYRSLVETKAPMGMIAEMTGFKNARSFRICFRRYFKCDPIWLVKAQ